MTRDTPGYEIRSAIIEIPDHDWFLDRLRRIMSEHATTVICFNAENMLGLRHAEAAITHALRSVLSGSPIAKNLEMEALLYAAGTRQCSDAGIFGIQAGMNRAYVCCTPPAPMIWDALAPLMQFVDEIWDVPDCARIHRLKLLYAISDEEISAAGGEHRLQDLIIERVALLDVYR